MCGGQEIGDVPVPVHKTDASATASLRLARSESCAKLWKGEGGTSPSASWESRLKVPDSGNLPLHKASVKPS
jgi:hypothetical protein